jgi:hypothetical protein
MAHEPGQVRIGETRTEIIVTEGIGPLSAADVRRIVSLVLEQVGMQRDADAQRENDTAITNRVIPPAVR